ncbi:hypothetical protein DERP_010566 [Dermatophagoides pteronyssinus]|uniref:Uncharacterized protein n=1 Tax=Dermatophagoides pteronyssinus TaxID=6956 RepID=A0ABQ8JFN6_DERPT|nr:hypothetical protein DERP_010566 [Dermatophagoides pteronyssinus]
MFMSIPICDQQFMKHHIDEIEQQITIYVVRRRRRPNDEQTIERKFDDIKPYTNGFNAECINDNKLHITRVL